MALHSAKIYGAPKQRPDVTLSSGQLVLNFHGESQCFGDVCPVHKPTEHSMRDWPLAFVSGSMVRIVPGVTVSEAQGVRIPQFSERPVPVVIDPDDYGFLRSGSAVLRNSGVCPECGDELQSNSRHDFQECKCGKNFVDGGTDYIRRTVDLIDTSLAFYEAPQDTAELGADR